MSRPNDLAQVYSRIGVPLDRLPYSDEMDQVVAAISEVDGKPATCRETWRELVDLRKRGKLPRVGRVSNPR